MARLIKSENCVGIQYDGPRDPARNETTEATQFRLQHMVDMLEGTITFLVNICKRDPNTDGDVFDLKYRKMQLQKDLDTYKD
jgi:hypothetical protein